MTKPEPSYPDLMSARTVGQYLDMTIKSVNRRLARGRDQNDPATFPEPIKVGSSNRWRRTDLDSWISKQNEQG